MFESWGWVYLTFMAAGSQALRTGGQKHLTQHLTTHGVTLVRFAFGLPFAVIYLFGIMQLQDRALPEFPSVFFIFCLAGALSQILATMLLVYLFSLRNFAVGTTYARTEAFLTAVVGALLFGEVINFQGWLAIGVSVIGVVIITAVRTGVDQSGGLLTRLFNRPAAVGLASGFFFALSALFIRQASLSLHLDSFAFPAALTLVTLIVMQCVMLGSYLIVTQRDQFAIMAQQWKVGAFVGGTSTLGSIGWFTAFTMQNAGYVKALGQIEFIFTLAISMLFFKEKSSRGELLGMLLVVLGIVYLLVVAR